MAQISIREYDVKQMLHRFLGEEYQGIQLRNLEDISKLSDSEKYVIKPDMLFGKRGKRGLLGINLSKEQCKSWLKEHLGKSENIDGVDGTLDVFLAEKCISPQVEHYLSFAQSRDGDIITYSAEGGIEIEENWEKTSSLIIPVSEELTENNIKTSLLNSLSSKEREAAVSSSPGGEELRGGLISIILKLFSFYKSHGFVSLEFNPIAQDNSGNIFFLDAVAKIDDQEEYLQKSHWKDLEIPNNYGFRENAGERYIRELDAQTGASLKMKILNPDARIWTLFAGGGGSLVMTDTLGALGYADEIGNYGECSGNPTREFTYEYTKTLLGEMLKATPHPASPYKGEEKAAVSSLLSKERIERGPHKYLIIAGAIANFTHVDKTFAGVIDALEENIKEILSQKVTILVRRGGINEKKGLKILEDACKKLNIPAIITGSDSYMTDILQEIQL